MATQGRSPLCSNDPWVHTCAIHVYAEGRPNSGYRRYRVRGIACRLIDAGLLAASFGHEGVNWRNITRRLPTAGVVRCIINLKLHCRSSDRERERERWPRWMKGNSRGFTGDMDVYRAGVGA